MISPWTSPTVDHPVLALPALDRVNAAGLINSPVDVQVAVDSAFIAVWNGQYLNLDQGLVVLAEGFGRLSVAARGRANVYEKQTANDYVTDLDLGLELLIREWIRLNRPNDRVIGEEGSKDVIQLGDTVWFVDPVDGTSNFVDGSDDVSLHVGVLQDGIPVASVVGLPFQNRVAGFSVTVSRESGRRGFIIGTEFRNSETVESITFSRILERANALPHRVKSIGVNIVDLLEGRIDAFYKPKAKLWDVLGPAALVFNHFGDAFDITMVYEQNDGIRRLDLFRTRFDVAVIDHLNRRHALNCRAGLVMIIPKNRPELSELITEEVSRCMSLSL